MEHGDDYRRGRHAVSALYVHLVFVTKVRRGVLREEHHAALREVFAAVCADFGARLVEAGGEDDHVHLVVEYPPPVSVSGLIGANSVQTAAQPPSAFMPRWRACDHGFSSPKPVQWGTW